MGAVEAQVRGSSCAYLEVNSASLPMATTLGEVDNEIRKGPRGGLGSAGVQGFCHGKQVPTH